MIAPKSKLLGWAALVVLPAATLAGLAPETAPPLAALTALLVLAAAIDLALAKRCLQGLSLRIPPVVRLGEHAESSLDLVLANPGRRRGLCLLGLSWPEGYSSQREILEVPLDPERELLAVAWPFRAGGRGRRRIDSCCVGVDSPLGWWTVRRLQPVSAEFRSYPTLRDEKRALAALLLHRNFAGAHALRQIGQGREFEKLREYVPGDGYEDIDWKATARRRRPVTRVYRTERTQEIYVVLDCSRLSGRLAPGGRPGQTLLDLFIGATLLLSLAVKERGDLFGLITFGERVNHFLRAGAGVPAQQACREALLGIHSEDATPDFEEVASAIRLRFRRRALFLFLTSLDDPVLSGSLATALEIIRRQHLIAVQTVAPPDLEPVFSRPQAADRDALALGLAGHLAWQPFAQTCATLRQRGIRTQSVPGRNFPADLVRRYLDIKQRQLL